MCRSNHNGLTTSGCMGHPILEAAVFAGYETPSSTAALEEKLRNINIQKGFATGAALATAIAVPGAGPYITFVLGVLSSFTFSDIEAKLRKAEIKDAILGNEADNLNSYVRTIRSRLAEANANGTRLETKKTAIEIAKNSAQILFERFSNKRHILRKHSLVTFAHFATVAQLFWSLTKLSTTFDSGLSLSNAELMKRIEKESSEVAREFIIERMNKIRHPETCNYGDKRYCVIEDNPWTGEPFKGKLCYWVTGMCAIASNKLYADKVRGFSSYGPEENAQQEYMRKLTAAYHAKFRKMLPIPPAWA